MIEYGLGFWLKKSISMALLPMSLGLMVMVLGLWYLHKNAILKAKIFLSIALIAIVSLSSLPLANGLIAPLEESYPQLDLREIDAHADVRYLLLLGGDARNRAWEVLRIKHRLPNITIITSGYKANTPISEANKTAILLEESGVAPTSIIIHDQPKDTHEEAQKMVEVVGKEPFFLVTSAYHMSRAIKIFKKAGLHPIPAPTDYKIKPWDESWDGSKATHLQKSELALHEYLGIVWQYL